MIAPLAEIAVRGVLPVVGACLLGWFWPTSKKPHECPACRNVLPSHRARFHDPNYSGPVLMVREKD